MTFPVTYIILLQLNPNEKKSVFSLIKFILYKLGIKDANLNYNIYH